MVDCTDCMLFRQQMDFHMSHHKWQHTNFRPYASHGSRTSDPLMLCMHLLEYRIPLVGYYNMLCLISNNHTLLRTLCTWVESILLALGTVVLVEYL